MSQQLSTEQEVVDYLTASSAFIEKSAAEEQRRSAQDKRAAEMIPQAVDALVQNGFAREQQREKLAKVLTDPARVLEVLIETATFNKEASGAQVLGSPAPASEKRASSLTDPRVGARRGDNSPYRESDMALFKHFPNLVNVG